MVLRPFDPDEQQRQLQAWLDGRKLKCPACGGDRHKAGLPSWLLQSRDLREHRPNVSTGHIAAVLMGTCEGCGHVWLFDMDRVKADLSQGDQSP